MNPWQFIPGFISGVLLAWIYMKTRSLIPVILIHIINNSLSYFIMFIYGEDIMTFRDLFTETTRYYSLFFAAAALLVISLLIIYRLLKPMKPFPAINPEN